ncbi:hypothetical protein LINGRAHAP2_LOCUS3240 [Linum grandiflorum]
MDVFIPEEYVVRRRAEKRAAAAAAKSQSSSSLEDRKQKEKTGFRGTMMVARHSDSNGSILPENVMFSCFSP